MADIKTNNSFKEFAKGIFKENPVFVILLGLCPTLAVTTSVANGIGMGIAATFVLLCSNILVSSLRNFIPEKIRIPSYIVIIASFVTIVDLLLQAYLPPLAKSLGVFVQLLVVNCIILGRAEAFASKNNIVNSILDALGMGLGFTIAITLISLIREVIGTCGIDFRDYGAQNILLSQDGSFYLEIFGKKIEVFKGALVFIAPGGAFIVVGVILAAINYLKILQSKKDKK